MLSSLLMMMLLICVCVQSIIICPAFEIYSPCTCTEPPISPDTIEIDCVYRFLSDSRMNEIMDALLTTPGISPVSILFLSNNLLTRVPDQIRSFPRLITANLDYNKLTSIDNGAFNFTTKLSYLNIFGNQIATIAPGAFQGEGYGNRSWIEMQLNNLTRFESTVFQSILEKIAPYANPPYTGIDIDYNPFNCSDCHLAWLIRDNRHLLPAVYQGTCSNGTNFEKLDPNGYADCPSFVCPLGYDGYYADPLSCFKFYICNVGDATSYDCPPDFPVFNPETKRCDTQSNAPSCNE